MNRILLITSIFVLGLLIGLLVLAYFAYVIETGPPESSLVEGLGSDVTVSWSSAGIAAVQGETTMDAMVGLGYAQASRRTWPLLLYRAVALGRLSELSGSDGLDSDRAAIRLGIGDGAREAYKTLSDEHRSALSAFAAGVNAALDDRRILRDPALILSGADPRPWEPWHSIAVERLFAWLGADARADTAAVRARPIREALLLHDFSRSAIVAPTPPLEPGIYARFVFGSSALPVLFEARVSSVYGQDVQGASLLGTPFFLAGRTDTRAWAVLPAGTYGARQIGKTFNPNVSHRRILLPDQTEQLVSILADSSGVVLDWDERSAPEPDSTILVVSWTGLGAISDAESWLQVVGDRPRRFALFGGAGVIVSEGDVSYLTDESSVTRSKYFVTLAESPWVAHFTRRLDSLASEASGFLPREWFQDTYSLWAAETTPVLLSRIEPPQGPLVRDAVAYLRNWDYSFDRASIAASIFNVWAEIVYEIDGSWPGLPTGGDAVTESRPEDLTTTWQDILEFAVARLATDFGSDMSNWRWERVHAGELRFPLLGDKEPGSSRFVPTVVSGLGHPSTPAWGPPAVYARLRAHGFWEGWTVTNTSRDWITRRIVPETDATFRGSSASVDSRQSVAIGEVHRERGHTTTLKPSR